MTDTLVDYLVTFFLTFTKINLNIPDAFPRYGTSVCDIDVILFIFVQKF